MARFNVIVTLLCYLCTVTCMQSSFSPIQLIACHFVFHAVASPTLCALKLCGAEELDKSYCNLASVAFDLGLGLDSFQ